MTAHATVYSQPDCQPCRAMKRMLGKYGIPYVERDVRTDPVALDELMVVYKACAPGRRPATPVVVIDDADSHGSREILFGPAMDDMKSLVRDGRIAVAEAS